MSRDKDFQVVLDNIKQYKDIVFYRIKIILRKCLNVCL